MQSIKVAIIGAGTAGLSARRQVALVTDDYLVFDGGPIGTTCARVGCMPSKVLIQIANDFHKRHHFETMGIHAEHMSLSIPRAMEHVRGLRDRFVAGVLKDMGAWKDSKLVPQHVRFHEPHVFEAGGVRYRAEKVIIATGTKPIIPKEWMSQSGLLIDTDRLFELRDLPRCIAVIGLGVIGAELGQALARLGIEVIGISKGRKFGGLSDPQIVESVAGRLGSEFLLDDSGVQTLREVQDGGRHRLEISSANKTYQVDAALVALGRRPALDTLGWDNLGLDVNDKGFPYLEDGTLRIKGTEMYFAGDVNGLRPVLHEASDQGRMVGFIAAAATPTCFEPRTSLTITFTDPNVAVVGQGWKTLTDRGRPFVTGSVSFSGQGRAIVKHEDFGELRIYAEPNEGRLVGAELFAPDGEHLAHLLAWAIQKKLTVQDALSMPFYHPVTEEGIRTALRDAAKKLNRKLSAMELMRCSETPVL